MNKDTQARLFALKLLEGIQWLVECDDLRQQGLTEEELEGYLDMYVDKFFTDKPKIHND